MSGSSQLASGTLDFSQGTGNGGAVAGELDNSGVMTISGSTALQWDAADTFSNSNTLILSSGINFVLAGGGTLDNQGIINDQVGLGHVEIDLDASLVNESSGTFNVRSDGTIGTLGSPPGSFTNKGVLDKSVTSGLTSINVNFSNEGGAIDVSSGRLAISSPGGSNSGGVFTVGSGATLDLTGGRTVTYAGSYSGSGHGTIALEGGTLAIGSGGATFNFSGTVFQSSTARSTRRWAT